MPKRKFTRRFWFLCAAFLLALSVCGLLISLLSGGSPATLNVSSAELTLIQNEVRNVIGSKPVTWRDAFRDSKKRKTFLQLLLGQKLFVLKGTNIDFAGFAIALTYYVPCNRVILSGGTPGSRRLEFGPFDSGNYGTRWSAAQAIRKKLEDGGWHVERLTDGQMAILSKTDFEAAQAAKSFALQSNLCERFDHPLDSMQQQSCSTILSKLWQAGFLDDKIKGRLTEKHYRLVLRQLLANGWPSWEIRVNQTFPFPHVGTEFTPTLYRNGEVAWSPGGSQMGCAMDDAGRPEGNPVASMSGGAFRNGEVLQCKMELSQKINGGVWRKTLWTEKITLHGLRN